MSTTTKPVNQKAWFLILPVLICVAFSAVIPLMTVVNYSVQDIISPQRRVFVGTEWFATVMRDTELHEALVRQLTFSLAVLLVEIPLGIALALSMPAKGWKSSAVLVTVSLSLLIPWNVVGTIWQIYGRTDIGLLGAGLDAMWVGGNWANIADPVADLLDGDLAVANLETPTSPLASTEQVIVTSRAVAVNSRRLPSARSRTLDRMGSVVRELTTFCTD